MLKKFQVELQDEEIVKFVEFACPYAIQWSNEAGKNRITEASVSFTQPNNTKSNLMVYLTIFKLKLIF